MKKIITTFWKLPIPDRRFDWEAIREDYNEGDPIGYGITKREAIEDLLTQEDDLKE